MRHERQRYRTRGSDRQRDLFSRLGSCSTERMPGWEALPTQVRAELMALMASLILNHVHQEGASASGEAHDEP